MMDKIEALVEDGVKAFSEYEPLARPVDDRYRELVRFWSEPRIEGELIDVKNNPLYEFLNEALVSRTDLDRYSPIGLLKNKEYSARNWALLCDSYLKKDVNKSAEDGFDKVVGNMLSLLYEIGHKAKTEHLQIPEYVFDREDFLSLVIRVWNFLGDAGYEIKVDWKEIGKRFDETKSRSGLSALEVAVRNASKKLSDYELPYRIKGSEKIKPGPNQAVITMKGRVKEKDSYRDVRINHVIETSPEGVRAYVESFGAELKEPYIFVHEKYIPIWIGECVEHINQLSRYCGVVLGMQPKRGKMRALRKIPPKKERYAYEITGEKVKLDKRYETKINIKGRSFAVTKCKKGVEELLEHFPQVNLNLENSTLYVPKEDIKTWTGYKCRTMDLLNRLCGIGNKILIKEVAPLSERE